MSLKEEVVAAIRDVPDFPKPGIVFKDISPLLANGPLFERVTDWLVERFRKDRPSHVLGIESRGFLFGTPVAHRLGAGFVPARKPGKLPWKTVRETYSLEYGEDALEIHEDAFGPGDRVLVIDDLLATGGTAAAACALVEKLGADLVGVGVVIELEFLDGRARIGEQRLDSLVTI